MKKKVNIEKAKARGWQYCEFESLRKNQTFIKQIGPPEEDERICWAACWCDDVNNVSYPHWIDDDLLEDVHEND